MDQSMYTTIQKRTSQEARFLISKSVEPVDRGCDESAVVGLPISLIHTFFRHTLSHSDVEEKKREHTHPVFIL